MAVTLFEECWTKLLVGLLFLVSLLYLYSIRQFNYWKKRNIPFISGTFPFGSLTKLVFQRISLTDHTLELYKQSKGDKYVGFYSFLSPHIMINDLDIIKDILVKNFSNFINRGVYFNEATDPLSAHLFSIEGSQWKSMRARLSPTFSSGKMKAMYSTVKECAQDFQQYGAKLIRKDDIVDFKDITVRYGLDVISNTVLGLKGNNFVEDNTDMRHAAFLFSMPSVRQMVRITFAMMCRKLAKLFRMRFVPKEVEDYFLRVVESSVEYREKNNIKRNDFMQLLIDMKNSKTDIPDNGVNGTGDHKAITIREMAAHSFLFVAAGFETSSVTLCFCLYELALNPEIQDNLLAELDAAGDDVSYDLLHKLPYLEMVVNETLRKYPPLAFLQRECLQDYKLPDGQVIEKGTLCIIPIVGIQRDPILFPNPEIFDPERFSKENISNIKPYSYMPFGEGPRGCIGTRFGKMQVKTGLVAFLSKFQVEICEKTPLPIKTEKRTFAYNVEGGVWLRTKARKPC